MGLPKFRAGQQPKPAHEGEGLPEGAPPGPRQQRAQARTPLVGPASVEAGGVDHPAGVIAEHARRQQRPEGEHRPPAPGGVALRPQQDQQPCGAEGDGCLGQGSHGQDEPTHQAPASGRRPLHGQGDCCRVLPGHEHTARQAQQQNEDQGSGAERPMGGHACDGQTASGRSRDGQASGAGAPQPVGHPPQYHPAHGAPQEHGDDHKCFCGGARRRTRHRRQGRGQGDQRQEDMDVVDPVAHHARQQCGASSGRQLRRGRAGSDPGGTIGRAGSVGPVGTADTAGPAGPAEYPSAQREPPALRRSAWSKNSSSCRLANR